MWRQRGRRRRLQRLADHQMLVRCLDHLPAISTQAATEASALLLVQAKLFGARCCTAHEGDMTTPRMQSLARAETQAAQAALAVMQTALRQSA